MGNKAAIDSKSKFITNAQGENSLSTIVKALTKGSTRLDFLVGYFFFSGFCEICDELKDKPLRILVGMNADVDVNNGIREYTSYAAQEQSQDSKLAVRNAYFENLKNIINKADLIDSHNFEKSYRVFLKKLENGTLEVRKTKEPNHAKMYLFCMPSEATITGLDDSKVIIGSSNFSIQGFKARNEVNIYLKDGHDFEDGSKIFNELWEDSIPLINAENKGAFKTEVLKHTWLETIPSPYLMYVRTLYEYFKVSSDYIKTPKEITHDRMNQFFDVSYQLDAIRDGVAKIKKHSGVIIADVVGLGKSVIAAAIAANLNAKTVIITPPHLKSQWEDYASDFGLRATGNIYTSGKIKEAVDKNKNNSDLVIIIDEAHRYRNENTESYGLLHQLCAGNKVILLSATPFNNKPEDIFSLIKLFQIPTHSTIRTVENLSNKMAALINQYKKLKKQNREEKLTESEFEKASNELAENIREILDPVIIRRTRIDLEKLTKYKEDLSAQHICFSTVKPPQSQSYELGNLSNLYINTLNQLTDGTNGFKGARYKPLTYLKPDPLDTTKVNKKLIKKYSQYFDDVESFTTAQRNMADFIKQLLVRRFESSKYGFIKSLHNILDSMNTLRRWFCELKKIPMAKRVKLPDIDELKEMLGDETEGLFAGTDEIFQCTMSKENEKGIWYIDAEDISDDFLTELNSDIHLISQFLKDWESAKEDPKLKAIETTIKTSLKREPNRKIIIFTEFSDTADYLYENFSESNVRVMKYSSKIATTINRDTIRANFDAGYPAAMQKNDFDILVATDAISEGFSLHRAGTIYNYDIPYNPTRVIQRVGRINRINKKVFDELYIYNFFPTATGEEVSHTAEISTFKMKLFQAILGADTKILTEDETIEGYFGKEFTEAENNENQLSWDVPFRNELYRIENEERDVLQAALDLPQRCRIARENTGYKNAKADLLMQDLFHDIPEKGVLLFSRKGDSFRFCFTDADKHTSMLNPQQALTLFKAAKNEHGEKVSDAFYPLYENAKRMSGLVRTAKKKNNASSEALSMINFLKTKLHSEMEKEYLDALCTAMSFDALPAFYIKRIAKMSPNTVGFSDVHNLLSDSYLDTILKKERMVGNEPEIILLAEQLN